MKKRCLTSELVESNNGEAGPRTLLSAFSVALIALAILSVERAEGQSERPHADSYDVVILNGRVIDPETALDAIRNVGLLGDRIAVVTTESIQGRSTIDATGLVVAPGFIDMHAHGQQILPARVQALDGVTTALDLEAGTLPVAKFYANAARDGRPINYGVSAGWGHARIAELTGNEPAAEPGFFTSHFGDWSWQLKIASAAELDAILRRVQQGLDEGGLGIGILLGYAPGAGRKEYHALHELAARNGVPTFTHARYLSTIEPESSFEAYQEMIAVAASTQAQMHVCHLNSISLRDIGDIASLIRRAQSSGLKISVEAYPYGAGSTGIGAAMFRGSNWQDRLGGLEKSDFMLGGIPLSDQEFDRLQAEAPDTSIVVHMLRPDDNDQDREMLDQSILFPGGVIASDAVDWLDETGESIPQHTWPLPENAMSHPRSAGTFARFLRIWVKEREKISLLDAIAKLSLYPAQILGASVPQMHAKGRLQPGADADIVVFDLDTVSDKATFGRPAQTSVGFEYVLVAGEQLVSDGVLNTEIFPGRAIRRNTSGREN